MATIDVKVPDVGTDKPVDVIEISVKPGDLVAVEQTLVVLESDKATVEVPSPVAGTVVAIDPRWKGADSRDLLRQVVALLAGRGWRVGNVDLTIIAQAPKVAPHVAQMCANLAADLGVGLDCVNVKATTTEKLGFTGREEGIAAQAVALVVRA